ERKGLKEAQRAAHSHPSRTRWAISASLEGPSRTRWVISASLEGPSRTRWAISASLEGSGSTLEQVTHLHLARGHPSAQGTNSPAAQLLAVRRHSKPATPPRLKGQATSGRHSHSRCDR